MYNHEFCKNAHEDMHNIVEMWKNGRSMDMDTCMSYLVNRAVCKDSMKEDVWKDYHKDVYGADYPKEDVVMIADASHERVHGYNHNHSDCSVDIEMARIIDKGTTDHMRMLSDVLSEHFEDLMQINPRMYNNVLAKMRQIKA